MATPKQPKPASIERRRFLQSGAMVGAATFMAPAYRAKAMSDRDVADVYAFLQALPPPPPLSTLPLLEP